MTTAPIPEFRTWSPEDADVMHPVDFILAVGTGAFTTDEGSRSAAVMGALIINLVTNDGMGIEEAIQEAGRAMEKGVDVEFDGEELVFHLLEED